MATTVLMYDKGYEHIRPRLDALGLDLAIATFDRQFRINLAGRELPPGEAHIDYVWLSAPIAMDGIQEETFALVEQLASVKVLQTYNAGLDHPFYKRMSDKGTRLSNSSAQGVAIAEYVMGQVLAVLQPIAEQRQLQARKEWKITPFREISQTRWVVYGFGPIGREVTRRAKAFGAHVTVVRRQADTGGLADATATTATAATALSQADIIVLACPLNAETRGMAGPAFFAALKDGAILVNVARGALIDDQAMLAALDTPRIAAAVLDVFAEEPLPVSDLYWTHAKVRLTSHTSFAGSGVRGRWDALFLENIARHLKGEPLMNEVDPATLA